MTVYLRAERETAARITEEIGNLMKEIETLVEEKKKDSSDMAKMITPQEGDRSNAGVHWDPSSESYRNVL